MNKNLLDQLFSGFSAAPKQEWEENEHNNPYFIGVSPNFFGTYKSPIDRPTKRRKKTRSGINPNYIQDKVLEVIEVPQKEKAKFISTFTTLTAELPPYFLDIASKEIALSASLDKTLETLSLILKDNDIQLEGRRVISSYAKYTVNLVLISKLASLFGLDKSYTDQLISAYIQKTHTPQPTAKDRNNEESVRDDPQRLSTKKPPRR